MTFVPNSSTAGYLAPADTPTPLEDDALQDFLRLVVVGITGMDNHLVFPRWQADPPNHPDKSVTWAAIGVGRRTSMGYPQTTHDDAGDTLTRYEQLDVMVSFYGPTAEAGAAFLRDGLYIAQNREALSLAGFGLRNVSDIDKAPELFKSQWLSRADLTITMIREIRRVYPVLSILSLHGDLIVPATGGVIMDALGPTDVPVTAPAGALVAPLAL